jgi:hypothetical protein
MLNTELEALKYEERVIKGKLQFYVKYRLQMPEGKDYADEKINSYLDRLRTISITIKILENE